MTVTVNVPGSNFRTFADNNGTWGVLDIIAEPVGSETAGAAYLVDTLGLGEFEGKSNNIAILTANEGWYFVAPTVGKIVYDAATGLTLQWNGSAWVQTAGGGGSGTGLADRTISATSSPTEKNIVATDSLGSVFLDGADGAFDATFDPSLLVGMKVFFKRKDSVDNVNAINVKGAGGIVKATLTANGDWAWLCSHDGGTALILLASGSTA